VDYIILPGIFLPGEREVRVVWADNEFAWYTAFKPNAVVNFAELTQAYPDVSILS
jgi:hypothetical protein